MNASARAHKHRQRENNSSGPSYSMGGGIVRCSSAVKSVFFNLVGSLALGTKSAHQLCRQHKYEIKINGSYNIYLFQPPPCLKSTKYGRGRVFFSSACTHICNEIG